MSTDVRTIRAATVTAVDPRTLTLRKVAISSDRAYKVAHELLRDGFIDVKVYA